MLGKRKKGEILVIVSYNIGVSKDKEFMHSSSRGWECGCLDPLPTLENPEIIEFIQ